MTRIPLGLMLVVLLVGCSSSDHQGRGPIDAGPDRGGPQVDGLVDVLTPDAPVADAQTAEAPAADVPTADAMTADGPPKAGDDSRSDGGTQTDATDVGYPPFGPTEPCSQLPKLTAPPTLDGVLEPGLDLFPMRQTGFTPPEGNSSRFAAAWFDTGIYFFIEVTDPDLFPPASSSPAYYGDGAEFLVDHDGVLSSSPTYDNPGTRHVIIPSPASKSEACTRAELYLTNGFFANLPSDHFAGVATPTGYAIEVIVTATDLGLSAWTLSQGQQVGIDIGHNVSYPDGQTGSNGYRQGQYFEQGTQPWLYESQFCLPTLAGPVLVPPPDGGATADTADVPAQVGDAAAETGDAESDVVDAAAQTGDTGTQAGDALVD
jgi:hypothetical protein